MAGWSTIAGTLCLTVVLSRLARDHAGGCGPFTYPAAAFGPGAGFVVAWSYWISTWVTNAALALAVVAQPVRSSGPGSPDPRSPRPSPSR